MATSSLPDIPLQWVPPSPYNPLYDHHPLYICRLKVIIYWALDSAACVAHSFRPARCKRWCMLRLLCVSICSWVACANYRFLCLQWPCSFDHRQVWYHELKRLYLQMWEFKFKLVAVVTTFVSLFTVAKCTAVPIVIGFEVLKIDKSVYALAIINHTQVYPVSLRKPWVNHFVARETPITLQDCLALQCWHSNMHLAMRPKRFLFARAMESEWGCCKSNNSETQEFQEPKVYSQSSPCWWKKRDVMTSQSSRTVGS